VKTYEYTWKIGLQITSSTELKTNKPLAESTVLLDLLTGDRYAVQKIYDAKPTDKAWSMMPNTVVHSWPAGKLAESELDALREKAKYSPESFSRPLEEIAFY
jgi:hypothetical protein